MPAAGPQRRRGERVGVSFVSGDPDLVERVELGRELAIAGRKAVGAEQVGRDVDAALSADLSQGRQTASSCGCTRRGRRRSCRPRT